MDLAVVFCVGFVASILSGIAGGGGGFITAPFFILFGIPPQVAIATVKFGGIGITAGSLFRLRGTGNIRTEYVIPLSILAVITGILGSYILVSLDTAVVTRLIGMLLLASAPLLFINKESGLIRLTPTLFAKGVGYVLYTCILLLQAAFGSGVGTILPLIMTNVWGFTFLESAATRRVPGMIGAFSALASYMVYGVVNYKYGIIILVGTFIGSWIGTHIALKQGNIFVKYVLCSVLVLAGIKLLFL